MSLLYSCRFIASKRTTDVAHIGSVGHADFLAWSLCLFAQDMWTHHNWWHKAISWLIDTYFKATSQAEYDTGSHKCLGLKFAVWMHQSNDLSCETRTEGWYQIFLWCHQRTRNQIVWYRTFTECACQAYCVSHIFSIRFIRCFARLNNLVWLLHRVLHGPALTHVPHWQYLRVKVREYLLSSTDTQLRIEGQELYPRATASQFCGSSDEGTANCSYNCCVPNKHNVRSYRSFCSQTVL